MRPAGLWIPARELHRVTCREIRGLQLQATGILSELWGAAHGGERGPAGR
jgi:hypothetical protein